MKRIIFYLSEILLEQLEEAVLKGGFQNRSELLRFLIQTHCKENSICLKNVRDSEEKNEDDEVDLEFGIPPHIVKEIEVEARRRVESGRDGENFF